MGLNVSIYSTSLENALKHLSYRELETGFCINRMPLVDSAEIYNLCHLITYYIERWCLDNMETDGCGSMRGTRVILTTELANYISYQYLILDLDYGQFLRIISPLMRNEKKVLYLQFS
jgi:hypothetical protein